MDNLIDYKNLVDYSIRRRDLYSDSYDCHKIITINGYEFGHHMNVTINESCNTGLINGKKYQLGDPIFEDSWAIHFNDFAKIVIYQDCIEVSTTISEMAKKFKKMLFKDFDEAVNYFKSITTNNIYENVRKVQ